jgi:hypothetical protein
MGSGNTTRVEGVDYGVQDLEGIALPACKPWGVGNR